MLEYLGERPCQFLDGLGRRVRINGAPFLIKLKTSFPSIVAAPINVAAHWPANFEFPHLLSPNADATSDADSMITLSMLDEFVCTADARDTY